MASNPKILNRSDVVSAVANKLGIPLTEADRNLDALLEAFSEHLVGQEGHQVRIKGFGAFCCRRQKPRTVKHPQSGRPCISNEKLTVRFRPYGSLEAVLGADLTQQQDASG